MKDVLKVELISEEPCVVENEMERAASPHELILGNWKSVR
jgi:hypothetical protein